jgi:hypothetical protein
MIKKILTSSIILLCFFSISSVYAEDVDMRNTYSVAWVIDTDDSALFNSTINAQGEKLLNLWTKGIVENVYLDTKKSHQNVHKGDIARVMFFLKAKTDEEAIKILNDMPLVKNKVAKYTLNSVGILWLKQF